MVREAANVNSWCSVGRVSGLILLGVLVGGSPALVAQEVPGTDDSQAPSDESVAPKSGRVEEIVVTARGERENLQIVPLAIAAFSGGDLEDRGIESLAELAQHTAGLEFATTGNVGGDRPMIRGLSQQTRVGDETNVGTFIDGVYSPGFSGSSLLFDALERVEVVRGPQSASYGRNSFAGAINYISKKPGDDPDYGARSTLGSDDQSALSTYISGPIVDALAGRVDLAYRQSGGTFTNAIDGETLSNKETFYGRGALRWTVGPLLIDGAVAYTDDDYSPSARTTIAPDDPRRVGKPAGGGNPFEIGAVYYELGPDTNPPRFGRRLQGEIRDQGDVFAIDPRSGGERASVFSTLSIQWDAGPYDVTSLSGYQTRQVTSISDVDRHDYGNPYACALEACEVIGQPLIIQSVTGSREDRDEFSQDFRLAPKEAAGPFTWAVGVYYSTEDFRDQRIRAGSPTLQYMSTTCPPELFGTPPPTECVVTAALPEMSLNLDAKLENEFYSVYGALDIKFLDTWTLALEGRETWEIKGANNIAHNFPTNSLPEGDFGTKRFDYFTPRITLSDQVAENVLLYALTAKGVKSGGFNANALCVDDREYDVEENWTYELGGKFTLWDNRARVNVSGYFIDWSNQQVTGSGFEADCVEVSTEPVTRNIATTEVWGSEVEITAAPVEWLELNLTYTFTDGKYTDAFFQTSTGWVDCEEIGTIDCVFDPDPEVNAVVSSGRGDGNQLVNTSRHLFNMGAEVTLPLGSSAWDGFFRADLSWQDKRYVDSENIGWVPSRENVNVRLGARGERWDFQAFCDNLTDDQTPLTGFPPRDFLGVPSYEVTNRNGRMYGVTIGFRYGGGER